MFNLTTRLSIEISVGRYCTDPHLGHWNLQILTLQLKLLIIFFSYVLILNSYNCLKSFSNEQHSHLRSFYDILEKADRFPSSLGRVQVSEHLGRYIRFSIHQFTFQSIRMCSDWLYVVVEFYAYTILTFYFLSFLIPIRYFDGFIRTETSP